MNAPAADLSHSSPHPAARLGIGGPVGSGKTALLERLVSRFLAREVNLAVITNDLVTAEDAERVRRSGVIAPERVLAVETGACPHNAIREDPSLNLEAIEQLEMSFPGLEMVIIESGGDNLASTFSRDLADLWIFVIDVAGGGDIPRKNGPGVLQADALVINKTDLAEHVDVDLSLLEREAREVRDGRPVFLSNCRADEGLDPIVDFIHRELLFA